MSSDLFVKRQQATNSGWTISPFSDAAERLVGPIFEMSLPWLEEYGHQPWTPHGEHLYDGECSICKAGAAPGALRVVIDAVLDAAVADPEVAAALRWRLGTQSGSDQSRPTDIAESGPVGPERST
jgi:hypothetical protein